MEWLTTSDLPIGQASSSYRGLGLARNASRACMLADVLAWAANHDLPFQECLLTLPFVGESSHGWSGRTRKLIQWLDDGVPLSDSMRQCFGKRFPSFYYLGLDHAEENNALATALPILARQLNYPCDISRQRKAQNTFLVVKILAIFAMTSFISQSIVPHFEMIFDDLSPATAPAFQFEYGGLVSLSFYTLIAIVLIALLPRFGILGETLLLTIPGFRRSYKRVLLAETAQSMSALLEQGGDILTAADWARRGSRSTWMRTRLSMFIDNVEKGTPWIAAWEALAIGKPIERWVIRNAAAREDPASGFALLAEWLYEESRRASRRIESLFDPVATLALALIVGSLAYTVFLNLRIALYGLM